MAGPPPALTGYKYKEGQLALANAAAATAEAQVRTARDREYDLQRAQSAAAITGIGAGGAQACIDAAALARADVLALQGQLPGLAGADLRRLRGQIRAAQEKADRLAGLALLTNEERQQAILDAQADVANAQAAALAAAALRDQLAQQAQDALAAAQGLPNLGAAWAKDHSAADRSLRSLEADLRAMRADLAGLGVNAPPGALAYCDTLENRLDQIAHRVPCPRCHADHGIDRTTDAKTAVRALFQRLELLGARADNAGLSPQQVLDRSIAVDMNRLKDAGGGKMLGVLICTDGTVLQAFSGDSAGRDDVSGWCEHVPPAEQGGTFLTGNGAVVPLNLLPAAQGTPHGVCAAPKLIQKAYAMGKVPAQLAEIWYGGGNVQPHGALVASCTTCRSNLDVQLCNAYP